ncbi:ribosomal RNA small subunit methyltransferase G [Aureimonas sp. SA4125]|uniref:16S rRNA (guanine(527)-N(7))-methyltransferase RsmG n=1 Tax=Aureimonas sp. SA4125 TaxID=2826993 RepID=UPI001CC4954E|nr:16S rRNA (guanine(527)-N(7))-methyltransferase RsmG [Aureimonas sp. SA4125]BDA86846.1 ribosomal RNA small subunit methyltransferase G [Aureimonas sp. SA4125]
MRPEREPPPRVAVRRTKKPDRVDPTILAADRAAFLSRRPVSRETLERLDRYVSLLLEWQAKTNLVASSTLAELWTRHLEDSLQLAELAPTTARWCDLGSGGGFPGIVTAILGVGIPDAHVDLIESNDKKAAFLRAAIRETGVSATVHAARIEDCAAILGRADAVSARALASLDLLFGFVAGRIRPEIPCYFAKGGAHSEEIVDASRHWRFTLVKHASATRDDAAILEVRSIARRGSSADKTVATETVSSSK